MRSRHRLAMLGERCRALLQCDRGASAAEFAVVVPTVAFLLTGTVDLAQLANRGLNLDAAMRAGAAYALGCNPQAASNCATKITDAITGYTTSLGGTVAVSFPSSDSSSAYYPRHCTWNNGTTTVPCNNDPTTGGATCDASLSQCPKHSYVKIQAVQTLPAPLIPLSILPSTLTASLTVRVQ